MSVVAGVSEVDMLSMMVSVGEVLGRLASGEVGAEGGLCGCCCCCPCAGVGGGGGGGVAGSIVIFATMISCV